jgi:hypothetical protein
VVSFLYLILEGDVQVIKTGLVSGAMTNQTVDQGLARITVHPVPKTLISWRQLRKEVRSLKTSIPARNVQKLEVTPHVQSNCA